MLPGNLQIRLITSCSGVSTEAVITGDNLSNCCPVLTNLPGAIVGALVELVIRPVALVGSKPTTAAEAMPPAPAEAVALTVVEAAKAGKEDAEREVGIPPAFPVLALAMAMPLVLLLLLLPKPAAEAPDDEDDAVALLPKDPTRRIPPAFSRLDEDDDPVVLVPLPVDPTLPISRNKIDGLCGIATAAFVLIEDKLVVIVAAAEDADGKAAAEE